MKLIKFVLLMTALTVTACQSNPTPSSEEVDPYAITKEAYDDIFFNHSIFRNGQTTFNNGYGSVSLFTESEDGRVHFRNPDDEFYIDVTKGTSSFEVYKFRHGDGTWKKTTYTDDDVPFYSFLLAWSGFCSFDYDALQYNKEEGIYTAKVATTRMKDEDGERKLTFEDIKIKFENNLPRTVEYKYDANATILQFSGEFTYGNAKVTLPEVE